MFPHLTDSKPLTSLAPGRLAEFERDKSLRLPSLYKEFLLNTNGGHPEESVFPIQGLPLNPAGAVHFFFGIENWNENYDVVKTYEFFIDRGVPAEIVFIATTAGADNICLDLREGRNRVAYWDFRHHWGTGEWRDSDLYHVADSFEEFLKCLKPYYELGKYYPAFKNLFRAAKGT